jgi:hypothetical protein
MTRQQIYNHLKRQPEHILCELTKDDFRLAREFWKDDTHFAVAKTPWGETPLPCWTYHLREIVLEADRLAYLKQFLPRNSSGVKHRK